FIPVPKAKTAIQKQQLIDTGWTNETLQENDFINRVREKVEEWRNNDYAGVTSVTRKLLDYWGHEDREKKFFFCQIEALETLIYITEVAEKTGDNWILDEIKKGNNDVNPELFRIALKMATGSGKTVVMTMVIAWQALNKLNYKQDKRFTDSFIVIAPGITIKDRLSVLQPNNPNNYYKERDVVPSQYKELIKQANIVITNYHSLSLRSNERYKGAAVVNSAAKTESPAAMINRVFKQIKNKKNIIVINDEAHHCYRERKTEEKLKGDDKKDADKNNEAARVWLNGIEMLKQKIGVSFVVDLSATPSFLKGSGHEEGKLFPWVISDFSLIDAIESGIVKIPRVPTQDDTINKDDMPDYRNLWIKIRDDLPKKGKKKGDYGEKPHLPVLLETALTSLYENYEKSYTRYEKVLEQNPSVMPPVMIVVCNNTSVSELVYRWISGYEIEKKKNTEIISGKLEIFRNEKDDQWLDKPNTMIFDSAQIESGNAIDDNFKKTFIQEIKEFQYEYKDMYPGREIPSDEELLREAMNTVGKKGRLGENIKCVVSVSMLTEGWDANTVTHILGVRAFSTQLLCEQVVGRGLRRISFDMNKNKMFEPEYAEIYGVPFSFIPTGGTTEPPVPKIVHRVKSLDERGKYEITYPRLEGYRYDFEQEILSAEFDDSTQTIIENIPTKVIIGGVVGPEEEIGIEILKAKRKQEVVYEIANTLTETHFLDSGGDVKYWLFPQLKEIVSEYVDKQVVLKDNMVYGFLLLSSYMSDAVTKINQCITKTIPKKQIVPILARYDSIGSTQYVDFTTTKPVRETIKSHINYVVADTEEWEQGVAKKLEDMDEVECYVKNQGLNFYIPYEYKGITRAYMPDFIVRINNLEGNILNLIIEVTGKKDDKKKIKVDTVRNFWIPAVNNAKEHGQWEFIEIRDIHETQNLIRYGLEHGFNKIK
ncbi:BPTD_3080 family restriction endonuclease, partial [Patescibacteria group bacterium]